MKKWGYFFISSFLLLIPQLVLAENATAWFKFKPRDTDLSVKYLCSIFGSVNGVLNCGALTPDTIFGGIFKVLNIGMLAIAGLVLIFTTVKAVTESAAEGTPMGQHTSHWNIIRVVLGNSLLVPGKSGYSAINAIVIWMVMQGIGFANMAWENVLDYLSTGGVIHAGATATGYATDRLIIDAALALKPDFVYSSDTSLNTPNATDIFRSLVCMHSLERTVKNYLKEVRPKQTQDIQTKIDTTPINFRYNYDFISTGTLKIPSINSDPLDPYNVLITALGWNTGPFSVTNLNSVCGSYIWNTPTSIPATYSGVTVSAYQNAKAAGVGYLVNDLDSIASSLVNNVFDGNYKVTNHTLENSDAISTMIKNALVNAANSYMGSVNTVRNAYFTSIAPKSWEGTTSTTDQMKADGWVVAGRYFWAIVQAKSTTLTPIGVLFDYTNGFQDYGFSFSSATSNFSMDDSFDSSGKEISTGTRGNQWAAFKGGIKAAFDQVAPQSNSYAINYISAMLNFTNTAGATANAEAARIYAETFKTIDSAPNAKANIARPYWDLSGMKAESLGLGITGSTLTATGVAAVAGLPMAAAGWSKWVPYVFLDLMDDLLNTWEDTMNDTTKSPIEKLVVVGNAMIYAATRFWDKLFDLLTALSAVYGGVLTAGSIAVLALAPVSFWAAGSGAQYYMGFIAQAVMQTWGLMQTAFTVFVPAAIGITVPLFVTGLTLSVYVPLIPFMLFTFGVVSWLIFVLECIAASPLIALGVTHPEGHQLLGKSEQALMLLVSVFLRPVLMIVGLVAGIVLSYVAVEILNYGFSSVVNDLRISASVGTGSGNDAKLIMVIVLYTFFVMSLVNQCFSLIYHLPDEIMKYIGGAGHRGAEAEKYMGEVKGEFGRYGEAISGVSGAKTAEAPGQVGKAEVGATTKLGEAQRKRRAAAQGGGTGAGGTSQGGT